MDEIAMKVPSLDPLFAIFIVLCSCDFKAVESACDNHILTGRVQTKNGAPLSEAKIALLETPYRVLAQTDDKGFFKALNVCTDANQDFLVSRDGFVPVKLKATVSSSTTANLKVHLENAGIQFKYSFINVLTFSPHAHI